MRDLAGFALLLVATFAVIYFLVNLVVPFLLHYCFGVFAFFVLATVIVLKGRMHPQHLEGLLKPGLAPLLALLAVFLPLAHATVVWVLGGVETWWTLFLANAIFPVLWTARLLLVHRRQKQLYFREGHDLEDLQSRLQSRENALEILDDALSALERESADPEPWEQEVGLGPLAGLPDRTALENVRQRIAALRARYSEMAREITSAIPAPGQEGGALPVPGRCSAVFDTLEEEFRNVRQAAQQILDEASYGTKVAGWEEVR